MCSLSTTTFRCRSASCASATRAPPAGIKNIIAHLGTDVFPRVKVGVGAPSHPDYDMVDWVIGSFSAQEKKIVDEALDRALDAAECIISRGVTEAQNRFN